MKKHLCMLLVLLIGCQLLACGNTHIMTPDPKQPSLSEENDQVPSGNDDNVQYIFDSITLSSFMEGFNPDIFIDTVPIDTRQDGVYVQTPEVPIEETFQIGDQTIIADLVTCVMKENTVSSKTYQSKDKKIRYTFTDNMIGVIADVGGYLCEYTGKEISEDAFLKFAQDFIASYIPGFDIRQYDNYAWTTTAEQYTENASWNVEKDTFYICSGEETPEGYTEKSKRYRVSIRKVINGNLVSDGIEIVFNKEGNIRSFEYFEKQLEWETIIVDREQINEAVAQFLKNNLKTSYRMLEYKMDYKAALHLNQGSVWQNMGVTVYLEDLSTLKKVEKNCYISAVFNPVTVAPKE